MLIRIERDPNGDGDDDIKIGLDFYQGKVEWIVNLGFGGFVGEGTIYNHDPEDILGIISKIYIATGKI